MATGAPRMATSVKVVTAYVDLGLVQRPSASFHALGHDLLQAIDLDGVCYRPKYEDCWLTKEPYVPLLPAANARALDRFMTDDEHVRSNIIQHSPIQWLAQALEEFPNIDVFVWMGYSLLKQGDFTGKRIYRRHVAEFIRNLKEWEPFGIPFPGMSNKEPLKPFGDNWRFCGSTLVIPRKHLPAVVGSYKTCARGFLRTYHAIPLDLAIWPMVENTSGLPFQFYKAEYDYTQLTNFPFKS